MRKIITGFFFMLLSCQTLCQVQQFTLNNGLKILVKEDHRAPIAVSMIWYNVGSADEQGGNTGVSHAIEHMMFKGTTQYPKGIFNKTIANLGGQNNAFTTNDYTAYFEKIDTKQLDTCFKLEADRMKHLLLDKDEFAKEIQVIQEERRSRTDNNPQGLAFERFLATAHLSSPYNHPVIGWISDLQQMQVSDLKKWYRQYYAPNNATLVVVGDIQPQTVYRLAQHYFGSIPQQSIPQRKKQVEPPALGKKQVIIHSTVKIPLLLIGYTVPSLSTTATPWQPYALELIAGLLSAGDDSRLNKNLIRRFHVASDAETYYNPYSRYQTQFIVYGSPNSEHTLQELKKALLHELELIKNKPIDTQELNKIKTQLIAQKTFEKDSIFSQAMELGLLETIGIGWKETEKYNEGIKQVTPEQIQQVAQIYFQSDNQTEAELEPITTAR